MNGLGALTTTIEPAQRRGQPADRHRPTLVVDAQRAASRSCLTVIDSLNTVAGGLAATAATSAI